MALMAGYLEENPELQLQPQVMVEERVEEEVAQLPQAMVHPAVLVPVLVWDLEEEEVIQLDQEAELDHQMEYQEVAVPELQMPIQEVKVQVLEEELVVVPEFR